ncbi:MAG: hypothetical protein K2M17_00025 [Bacilli bacterium]|nr:hypothetical protein [Bacilli bacterium]
MKNFITLIICLLIFGGVVYYLDPITDKITEKIEDKKTLVIAPGNAYTKNKGYEYVTLSQDYIPYSYQDLLNIYYSAINNGWEQFTFYCPSEYTNCLTDAESISGDELILTHLNNYIHPFNSFTNIRTSMKESGEITIYIYYLYTKDDIAKIEAKTNLILNSVVKDNMEDYDKIKAIHDYIVEHTKYDVERNEGNSNQYNSYTAYGPLFDGLATCNGYTDLMAIFLTKMGFDNYKIATTPNEISYSSTGHIWNAVYLDGKWLHIDLTWDDPVSSDGKDYLFHTYFLVTTEAMHEADTGKTTIEEHNFNKLYYLEFNNNSLN